jgi:two-component system phosphate regulon sensor histidine kinase PhoR
MDEMHLINVFTNLIDNALKYTRQNPDIVIRTSNTRIGLTVRVSDNGIGMTASQQKKIFDKFYRVPTGDVHDVKGFGLGLAYVKTIVELHGGSIQVNSESGKGSTFEVYLPFEQLKLN